jgi:signal transduction histidine kinase
MLVDRELLRHAVDNVAANAVRHTSSGEITFTGRNLGPTAELEIADTGSGMSEEAAARAFDRFHRSSATGGVGLGLAIAHEAVQALGGTIAIHSVLGEGTRVRIAVPSATLVN